MRYAGYLLIFLAALFWALIGPITYTLKAQHITSIEIAFWRALFACILFGAHSFFRGQWKDGVRLKDALSFSIFGIFGIGMLFASFLHSIMLTGAAMTVILQYTSPAWIALFSWWLFKESLTPRKLFALGIALSGALCVSLSGGSLPGNAPLFGIFCGLFSGVLFATHTIYNVWWQGRYPTGIIYTFAMLGGALALLPFVHFAEKNALSWFMLILTSLVCSYGAFLCYGMALHYLSPIQAGVLSNMEPLLATFFAWMWFNESFSLIGWAGAALILTAVIVLSTGQALGPVRRPAPVSSDEI